MMNQTPAQENLERLLDAKEKNDPKATKEAIEAAELAVKNEIQKIDASLAAHKAEINADMKKVNERIFARKKAKAEKAKVKDEKHAKLKEAAAKRRDGARAGEPRAIAANKAKEAEAKAKAEAEAAKPAAPVQAPAA
jgi:colicin import membrane protein